MKFSLDKTYLILLFYISPFIDALSGYLILSKILPEGGVGSPSQLFRLFLIILSILILLKNKKYFHISMILIVYIIFMEFVFFYIHGNVFGYIIGLVYGSKLIYLLLIYLTLYYLYSVKKISFKSLLTYIQKYVLTMGILLVVPFILGVGFSSYEEGTFGNKGFFAAGNGLGIFMGTGLMLSIYYWKYTRKRYSLFLSLFLVFSTVIIGTKTVFIFSLVALIFMIYYLKNYYLKHAILFILLYIFIFYSQDISDSLKTIFDVVFYRLNNNDSFISFLMSNRDVYFQDAISNISYEGLYALRLFFGLGAYVSFRNPYEQLNSIDILESDFSDIFFMYGLLVLFIYLFIFIIVMSQCFIKKQFFLGLIFFMLFSHSLLAGHVLFNGMSGIMLPFLILLILTFKPKIPIKGFR